MSICIITCNSYFFNTNHYNKYYFNDIYLSKHCKTKIQSDRFLINHTHFIKKLICKYYSLKFAIYYNELLIQHYDTTSIIETLYDKITDSDIKMIVYELYRLIVNGHDFNLAVNDFPYFSDDFKNLYLLFKIVMKTKV